MKRTTYIAYVNPYQNIMGETLYEVGVKDCLGNVIRTRFFLKSWRSRTTANKHKDGLQSDLDNGLRKVIYRRRRTCSV